MASEAELNQREIERLKKLLDIFPRDTDVEDVAELINNAKAVLRVGILIKNIFNVITVAGAILIGWIQFKGGWGNAK